MTQATLPFINWTKVTPAHGELLRIANSVPKIRRIAYAHWGWEKEWFYPFKSRVLNTHGVPDGCDLQVIKLHCYTCGGSGVWHSEYSYHSDTCDHCGGYGIYRKDAVILNRFLFGGSVFHCPGERIRGVGSEQIAELRAKYGHEVIFGHIEHQEVSEWERMKAFARLLWIYERDSLSDFVTAQIESEFWRRVRCPINRVKGNIRNAGWSLREWFYTSDNWLARDLREWAGVKQQDPIPF